MNIQFTPNKLAKTLLITIVLVAMVVLFRKRKTLTSITMNTINYLKEKTWDYITDRRIATLHPAIRPKVKEFIIKAKEQYGIKLRVTSTLRTWQEQADLYAQGRTVSGPIVTYAGPGQSYHNYGLAFDVVEMVNGKPIWKNPNWNKIAALGKSLGFEWGGDWKKKDRPHFQKSFGLHHTQLALLYKSGKRNGNYVII